MTGRSAVVFCMPEQGHFKRLLPLISGLAGAGIATHVFTDLRYREAVERAGGRFVDVFAGRPLEAADAKSLPVPCRYVSFAAHYADSVLREVAALRPALVVHDTFAVIGVVVANQLKLPRVAVCSGHNAAPGPTRGGAAPRPARAASPTSAGAPWRCCASATACPTRHPSRTPRV